MRRVTFDAFGWTVVTVGFAGVFLPIIPGVLLLLIGFYVLSIHSQRYGAIVRRSVAKYPHLGPVVARLDGWVKRTFNVRN